jgi:hypothetical protein
MKPSFGLPGSLWSLTVDPIRHGDHREYRQ